MTVDEFMDGLGMVRDQFTWKLFPSTAQPESFRLCAIGRENLAEGLVFDPIGALCYGLMGAIYPPDAWEDAGQRLGLLPAAAARLASAANDETCAGEQGERVSDSHLKSLRVRMIHAVCPSGEHRQV